MFMNLKIVHDFKKSSWLRNMLANVNNVLEHKMFYQFVKKITNMKIVVEYENVRRLKNVFSNFRICSQI